MGGTPLSPVDLDGRLDLGMLAGSDAEQAIDLVAMAALDEAIRRATELDVPEGAATGDAVALAAASAAYLETKGIAAADKPIAVPELTAQSNNGFADALETAIEQKVGQVDVNDFEAFGIGDRIRGAIGYLTRLVGNGASDAVLKMSRRDLSRSVSFFLGDVFVYMRGRDDAGAQGTRARIFKPILEALIEGAKAPRAAGEPFVVVGHSLGGVILYDMLTDSATRAALEAGIGGSPKIDALFTVGSQPGFFADLGLYPGGRPAAGTKLPMPVGVGAWMNVFDFTDVFSFRCAHIFEGVCDFRLRYGDRLAARPRLLFPAPELLQADAGAPEGALSDVTRIYDAPQAYGGVRLLVLGAGHYPNAQVIKPKVPKLADIGSAAQSAVEFANLALTDWQDLFGKPMASVDMLVNTAAEPDGINFACPGVPAQKVDAP